MYKPKNPLANTNRLRLDVGTKLPTVHAIEQQLQEAKTRRGCLVELPWTTTRANQLFILSVKWDPNADLPIWTLYEQNNMESKMHWSEQYPPGDLQIMYDVVTMSVTSSDEAAQIPESLRPKDFGTAAPAGQSAAPLATAAPQPLLPPQLGQPLANPYGVQAGLPGSAAPGFPAIPGAAGYGAPPAQSAPPPPPPPSPPGYPVDANAAPGYQYPYYNAPPGYPGAPPAPQAWPYGAPGTQPPMVPVPVQAAPPAPPPPMPPVPESHSSTAVDYSLISKRSKLQLGKLLVDARIIAQSTLDAALKVQELVEDGILLSDVAPNALNKWHTKGGSIGEFVNQPELEAEQPDEKRRAKIGEIPEVSKLPITPPKSAAEARGAFDLLKKSGILTDADIKAASEVRRKHGGDIIQILQSAGKLDKYTFESAVACLPLIELGLMKMEQVCIAVQYCCRMRVEFDTALEELGWQNPRRLRSDLNL